MKRRRKGVLEAEVLAALWAAQRPLTAGEVAHELGGTLAHTTVQTTLTRLLAKGVVRRQEAGRAHSYSAVLTRSGIAATRMRAQLDSSEDRESVLGYFLRDLTPEDEATLTRLLGAAHNKAEQ